MGVSDYQQYTGWWCRYKGKNDTNPSNIINLLAMNKEIQKTAANVWFEDFVPALHHFAGKVNNPAVADEFFTSAQYLSLLGDSAAMNYQSGWLLNTGSWIAPHTSIRQADFDFFTGSYTTAASATRYSQNFTDMYRYACDWMTSRAAWLSNEMYADYTGSKVRYDVDRNGTFDINDATALQLYLAEFNGFTALQYDIADANGNGRATVTDVTCMQRALADL